MAIETIVAGSVAQVQPLNSNFTYLDGRITSEIGTVTSTVNSHTSSITSLQTAVSTLQGENIKTGMIVYYTKSTAPTGYLVCDGSAVSRTTYATLFTAIGTTFGSGDESTTFNLPNLIDKVAWGHTTVGTEKSAGLPNITGQVCQSGSFFVNASGALYTSGTERHKVTDNSDYDLPILRLDASRSSSIYGNSTTVQPPALTLLPCIKY